MQNFSIIYKHYVDSYFDRYFNDDVINNYYEFDGNNLENIGLKISRYEYDYEKCLNVIIELKKVILTDFKRILENIVKYKKNNEELTEEIECLLDTYNNEIDFTLDFNKNFIVLTDNYLCFNNIENYIDGTLLGSLGSDAFIYETTIIVDRLFKNFYFIRKATNVLNKKDKLEIKMFIVDKNEIKSYKKNINLKKEDFEIKEYNELAIKKVLNKINK